MNRLIRETSPYLREHAHNPVEWFPWGDEAFEKARAEDKPIFLSIGYSACHWCHVMAHESFDDEEVANLLNESFVSVKVDREERPDVDEVYMESVRVLTGGGGWPLSVFLTPDLKPFYGGTYFPPEPKHNLPAFKRVLVSVLHYYRTERGDIEKAAESVTAKLREMSDLPGHEGPLDTKPIEAYYRQRLEVFDADHGGFGVAPKFPNPTDLLLLLRLSRRPGFDQARHMVELTLSKMAEGGIYDQVGGGFHRYSTDTIWLVPHFEKMLYDNALLAEAYAEASRAFDSDSCRAVAEEVLEYLEREMRTPDGAYYASQDADVPGRKDYHTAEGSYYVWQKAAVEELLGPELAPIAVDRYGITDEGNFNHRSVLRSALPVEQLLQRHRLQPKELWDKLNEIRTKLLEARTRRASLRTDEKVLADWNGLMLSALARAHQVFGEPKYLDRAQDLARFLRERMMKEGALAHLVREGQPDVPGQLSDYALVCRGFLDLYESDFDPAHLRTALALAGKAVELFADERGGFHTSADPVVGALARNLSGYDAPIPAGNSVIASDLLRLARITGENRLERIAADTLRRFHETVTRYPQAFATMLAALDYLDRPSTEVVLFLPDEKDRDGFLRVLRENPDPCRTVILVPAEEPDDDLKQLTPLVRDRRALEGKPTAFVCRGATCLAPVHTPEDLLARLSEPGLLDTNDR